MYRCCIFDLDGTLVNSIYALNHTINLTLAHYGLKAIDEEHTKQFVGDGANKLVERALIYSGDRELEHYEDAVEVYAHLFKEHCMYRMEAYDGIRELLEYLKEQKIKAAVLSNKPHERTKDTVRGVFGDGCFDLVSGEREGIPRKPDPAGALWSADQLGIKPSECLYLGDTNTDMMTGQAAGMDTAGVTWGFRDRKELEAFHPRYLVDSPEEVISILKKM